MTVHKLPLPIYRDIDKLRQVLVDIEERMAALITTHDKILTQIYLLEKEGHE